MTPLIQRIDAARARRAIIVVFCAFAGFVAAYGAFTRLTDPRAPFDAVARTYPEISLLFQLINIGFESACLAVLAGGLLVLYDVCKRAITSKRKDTLLLIALPLIALAAVFGYNVLVFNLWVPGGITPSNATPLTAFLTFSAQFLFLLAGVASVVGPALAVAHSEISECISRLVLALAAVVTLAMLFTLAATILWSARIWADAPQLFNNGAIALGLASGAAWLIIIVAMMALAIGIPLGALIRSLPKHASA
jgi:hypothetical protein